MNKIKKIIKFFFIVLIIATVVFYHWPKIEEARAATKTFYFHSEVSALAGNWLLKEAAPELIVDDSTRDLTSAINNTSILYKPGVNNNSATVIGHGTTTAQGFGWWSDTALNGTFDAGAWTFTIRNEDNRDSITSHFDINVFRVPQNTSVSSATLLFQHIGTVDFWTNSIKTTTETTATVDPFTFTNEYLFIEIWDHTAANPSSGRISRIHVEGSDLATANRSRVTTPNFTPPAAGTSSTFSLKMADAAKNPTLFYLSGGALWMQEGTSAAVRLTSSEVTVTVLQFTNVSYASTPGTVRIKMTVQSNNFEKTFYTTTNVRKK